MDKLATKSPWIHGRQFAKVLKRLHCIPHPLARMAKLRTLLVLGRVSNVPTVWSNCIAGWMLSGGGSTERLALLCLAATCLYIGGMYLNDAFDTEFDQQHRPERPIPSRAIRAQTVWIWGFSWLLVGLGCCFVFGKFTVVLALLLISTILLYDAIHKIIAFSPVLMAMCRLLLVLIAASTGDQGITGLSIWAAVVMASYIVGLSYLARTESTLVALRYWPCLFLAAPLVLALVVNQGEHQIRSTLTCVAVGFWLLRCLWFAFWSPQRNVGRAVAGLLAGIALIDGLSVWSGPPTDAWPFVGLFLLALLFQRFVPAT